MLNPVRAGLVKKAAAWPWSSYRATAGLEEPPAFLTTDWLLGQFARDRKKAQRAYRRFVAQEVGSSFWEERRGQVFLGSEEFVKNLPVPKEWGCWRCQGPNGWRPGRL